MPNNMIVKIDGNESGVVAALAKSEAAAKKWEQSLKSSGDAGAKAGSYVAKAMIKAAESAKRPVDSMLRQLRSGGDAGKDLARTLDREVKNAAIVAAGGIDEIGKSIVELRPELASVIDKWRTDFAAADKSAKFETTRKEIAALGEQFSPLAVEIEKATAKPLHQAQAEASQLLDRLREIDPSKAEAVARAVERASEAAERKSFDQLQTKLSGASTEAGKLASMLSEKMRAAALEAEGGIDGLVTKIVRMKPELASVAKQWRNDMAEANRKAAGSFGLPLAELEKLGPEASRVAAKIREELKTSGRIGEAALRRMLSPLDQADGKIAKISKSLISNANLAANKGTSIFEKFGRSAVASIGAAAGAYIGVSEAIQGTTAAINDQLRVLEDARQANITLAEAQASARKNLNVSNISSEQRSFLLDEFVQQVSAEFKIDDLVSITKAVGDAVSSGATFGEAQSSIRTSAALNVLSPDETDETAAAIVKTMKSTGITNPEVAADKLLAIGSQSQVVDPSFLFKNLPAVMQGGRQTSLDGKGTQGAMEAGAIFAALSKAAGDDRGDSSKTAAIQVGNKVREYFTENEDAKVKAADPGTPLARINYIKQNGLYSDFKEVAGSFGEEGNKAGIENLFQGGQTMQIAQETSRMLTQSANSVDKFRATVDDFAKLTNQLSVAVLNRGVSAADARQDAGDSVAAMTATIRKTVGDALADNRRGYGVKDYADEIGLSFGVGLKGGAGIEEAVSGALRLAGRRDDIARDGISPEEREGVKRLDSDIESLIGIAGSPVMLESSGLGAAFKLAKDFQQVGKRHTGSIASTLSLGAQYNLSGPQVEEAANNPKLIERMISVLEQQLELQRTTAEASSATAEAVAEVAGNTSGGNGRPNPSRAQRTAQAAR